MTTSPTLLTLPHEAMVQVLECLDPRDVLIGRKVCRALRQRLTGVASFKFTDDFVRKYTARAVDFSDLALEVKGLKHPKTTNEATANKLRTQIWMSNRINNWDDYAHEFYGNRDISDGSKLFSERLFLPSQLVPIRRRGIAACLESRSKSRVEIPFRRSVGRRKRTFSDQDLPQAWRTIDFGFIAGTYASGGDLDTDASAAGLRSPRDRSQQPQMVGKLLSRMVQ
ncbi:MAG: hypothetical protein SGARI_006514 [Bacillariaceae sp.]